MKNFIYISPNFPENFSNFIVGLKNVGFNVLGIGDASYDSLNDDLKNNLTEYYRVDTLESIDQKSEAIKYFINKYGPIDYLESNNEYWLRSDAELRKRFNIEGLKPEDMDNVTNKIKMKEFFLKGGAKVARYCLVTDLESALKFIKKVKYPVFTKPCVGVGAQKTYKISNEFDLKDFFLHKAKNQEYIMEEYIVGDLMSFDGVCDSKGDVVMCDESHFITPIDRVLNEQLDNQYYTTSFIDPKFEKIGRNVVKAFGIKKRFFHIEFFKLAKTKLGLGKKGDYIGLECNMRTPGGSTPDLINFALSTNCYQVYSDVMMFDENRQYQDYEKYVAIAVTRRTSRFNYKYSYQELENQYKNNVCCYGDTPMALRDALCDNYIYAKFKTVKEALDFSYIALKKD